MALANYTDLKASIATWMPRADLTTQIPDCITLAEGDFNNKLRTLEMETRANLTITGEYVTAPNDFREFRTGYVGSSPRRELRYLSPDAQTRTDGPNNSRSCGAVYFSLAGNSFRFDPPPTSLPVDAVIVYYASIPPLALNATNWLLTKQPQLYLMASLFWCSVLIKDAESAQQYKGLYESLLAEANAASKRTRWSGPGMQMRAA